MFEIVDADGRTPEHGYTKSSPCESDGSGELKSENGPKTDPLGRPYMTGTGSEAWPSITNFESAQRAMS